MTQNIKLIKMTLLSVFTIAALLVNNSLYASPVGYWKTIDDKTGIAKSILKIEEISNKLSGKIVKVLHTEDGSDPETRKCDKCSGKNYNKTIKGMTVLWGLTKDGDEWTGGEILDPSTGNIYSLKVSEIDNGSKLSARGYLGFSLFGRTQIWYRVSNSELTKYLAP